MSFDRAARRQTHDRTALSLGQWSFPLWRRIRWRHRTIAAVVVAALALVHCPSDGITAAAAKDLAATADCPARVVGLPHQVEAMRAEILAAAHAGSIEDLRSAIEWNELPPELGNAAGTDPIEHLKRISADGEGRQILAVLADILATEPAKLPIGADPENSTVYVWPGIAEKPLDKLSPGDQVELLRLMPAGDAKLMVQDNKWTWWRIAIGADGTWLTFMRHR